MSAVVPALSAALVARWQVLPALQAITVQGASPIVGLGVPVGGLGDPGAWLRVEFDGSPDARENARWSREWLDLACTRQREVGELVCTAAAQTGDDDVPAMEVVAHQLVDACVADLKSDLTVGGIVWSQYVASGSAQQLKTTAGVAVIVPFTVAYAAPV